jgi:hypothetical protein
MSTEIKKKTKSSSPGLVLNASSNSTKPFQSITAIVVSSRIQSMNEILNHILVDRFAEESEGLIAHIHVLSFAIKESVNLVNMKEL